MEIKVLGTGCAKCNSLEEATRKAVESKGIDASIEKVEDLIQIMSYGVMTTPALVIDGKVVVKGRVPSINEIMDLL